jgi:hypothetical protein
MRSFSAVRAPGDVERSAASPCLKGKSMCIVAIFILTLNSAETARTVGAEQHHVTTAKPGYSQKAPRFAQFPVRTKRKGERDWLSLGRCDQADGKAFDRLVMSKARPRGAIFAGHYSVVVCSCGTECGGVSIVDLQSGRIYDFDFISQACSSAMANYDNDLYFRIDSSLLILIGSPPNWKNGTERYRGCAIRYYRWTGRRLVLLKETPISNNAAEQSHAPERAKRSSYPSASAVRAPGDVER